ncbi:MAG: hypothetical protein K1X86_09095 [Ignavibacteria bacterium]|nr:hypothetical protein [Ignavibacteria bacterium]
MIEISKTKVTIPVATWNELKKDDYFKELIDVLEDSLKLEKAKKETKSFVDFRDYDKKRKSKK